MELCVRDELLDCGGTPVGAPFNQDRFKLIGGVEGNTIANDYCAGVVLDSARRVLQSSPLRDPSYLSYSAPDYGVSPKHKKLSRQATTVKRMAKGYERQGTSYVAETNLSLQKAALRKLANGVEVQSVHRFGVPVSHEIGKLLEKVFIFGQKLSSFEHFELDTEPAGWLPLKSIPGLLDTLSNQAARDSVVCTPPCW